MLTFLLLCLKPSCARPTHNHLPRRVQRKAEEAAAQAKLSGQSDLPPGSVSEGAPGSAEADPWAGL